MKNYFQKIITLFTGNDYPESTQQDFYKWLVDEEHTSEKDAWYDIALESGFDPATGRFEYPSDDMSTNYTPTYALFHGTIGYTCRNKCCQPSYNDHE